MLAAARGAKTKPQRSGARGLVEAVADRLLHLRVANHTLRVDAEDEPHHTRLASRECRRRVLGLHKLEQLGRVHESLWQRGARCRSGLVLRRGGRSARILRSPSPRSQHQGQKEQRADAA
jgi:hypothetical protein